MELRLALPPREKNLKSHSEGNLWGRPSEACPPFGAAIAETMGTTRFALLPGLQNCSSREAPQRSIPRRKAPLLILLPAWRHYKNG